MQRNRRRLLVLMSSVLVAAMPVAAAAKDPLAIQTPAALKKGVVLRDAVKKECGLQTKLPEYVESFARAKAKVSLVEDASKASGKTLVLVIDEVREAGTVGPKSVTISGELRANGKVIGSIEARRSSMGGPLGAFGGACGILHRCLKALGKDLSGWIEKPAMDVEMMN